MLSLPAVRLYINIVDSTNWSYNVDLYTVHDNLDLWICTHTRFHCLTSGHWPNISILFTFCLQCHVENKSNVIRNATTALGNESNRITANVDAQHGHKNQVQTRIRQESFFAPQRHHRWREAFWRVSRNVCGRHFHPPGDHQRLRRRHPGSRKRSTLSPRGLLKNTWALACT